MDKASIVPIIETTCIASSYAVPPEVKLWPSKCAHINNFFVLFELLFGIKDSNTKGTFSYCLLAV